MRRSNIEWRHLAKDNKLANVGKVLLRVRSVVPCTTSFLHEKKSLLALLGDQ